MFLLRHTHTPTRWISWTCCIEPSNKLYTCFYHYQKTKTHQAQKSIFQKTHNALLEPTNHPKRYQHVPALINLCSQVPSKVSSHHSTHPPKTHPPRPKAGRHSCAKTWERPMFKWFLPWSGRVEARWVRGVNSQVGWCTCWKSGT